MLTALSPCSSSSLPQPGLPAQNFSMSVTVPVSNPNTLTYSNPGSSLVSPSLAASSSLTDTTMLSPPQSTLHRNVSPGAPQRPPSAGNAGEAAAAAAAAPPSTPGHLCPPGWQALSAACAFAQLKFWHTECHNAVMGQVSLMLWLLLIRWNAGDDWSLSAKWSWYQSSG